MYFRFCGDIMFVTLFSHNGPNKDKSCWWIELFTATRLVVWRLSLLSPPALCKVVSLPLTSHTMLHSTMAKYSVSETASHHPHSNYKVKVTQWKSFLHKLCVDYHNNKQLILSTEIMFTSRAIPISAKGSTNYEPPCIIVRPRDFTQYSASILKVWWEIFPTFDEAKVA